MALLAFGYLLIYRPDNWILLVIIVAVIFGLIDSLARGRLDRYPVGMPWPWPWLTGSSCLSNSGGSL